MGFGSNLLLSQPIVVTRRPSNNVNLINTESVDNQYGYTETPMSLYEEVSGLLQLKNQLSMHKSMVNHTRYSTPRTKRNIVLASASHAL